MKNKKLEKAVIIAAAVFVVMALLFMFGRNLFNRNGDVRTADSTVMPEATGTTNEIKSGIIVEQDFVCTSDSISKLGIVFTRLAYKEGFDIVLELLEGNDVIASTTVKVAAVEDQHRTYIEPASKLNGMKGKTLTVKIYSAEKVDTGLVIMMNKDADTSFRFGGKSVKGTLCFSITE